MTEHAHDFLVLTILGFVTILLVFGMKYLSAARQTRLRYEQESGYRELADRFAASQATTAASLAAVQADLLDMKVRLATINTVLQAVE